MKPALAFALALAVPGRVVAQGEVAPDAPPAAAAGGAGDGEGQAAADRCAVRVVRAPDGLAAAITRELVSLSACARRLDVWVVRVVDGLYVIARDPLGRVRERVVPDTDVVAALIASWVEVDAAQPLIGAGAGADAVAVAVVDPPPVGAAEPIPAAPPRADVAVPATADADGVAQTMGFDAFVGTTMGGMTTTGASVDVDLFHHDGLSLAAMATVARDISSSYFILHWDDDFFRETGRWSAAALLELHRRLGRGRLRFTPALAFGLGMTRHEVLAVPPTDEGMAPAPVMTSARTIGPRIVATAALGVRIAGTLDLEVSVGWMFAGYQGSDPGVDPSDQAFIGGIGLRHDR